MSSKSFMPYGEPGLLVAGAHVKQEMRDRQIDCRKGMFRVINRARAATLLLALLLTGCGATRIVPPLDPRDPVSVFVLDHGRHTSLVLPAADGSLRRYAYGDWRYYAERDTGAASGLAALLWSTPGALGHRQMPGPATADVVRSQVRVVIVELHDLRVERQRVERLRTRLDALIAQAEHRLETPEVDLVFVPYPTGYHLGHNSNQMLADWLVELGCEVSRRPVRAGWQVESAR